MVLLVLSIVFSAVSIILTLTSSPDQGVEIVTSYENFVGGNPQAGVNLVVEKPLSETENNSSMEGENASN